MQTPRRRISRRASPILVACLLALAVPTLAQSSPNYDLSWHVVAGGGGRIESPAHTLHSTIGQPAAGLMGSNTYTLGSGFWGGGALAGEGIQIYLPVTMRGN